MDWTLEDCEYIEDYQKAQHFCEELQAENVIENQEETVIEEPPKPEKNNIFQTMNTQDFEVGYYHAEWFYQENQHLFVPSSFVCEDGFKLGVWIYNQRYKFEKNQLLLEEIEKLNQLEMIWNLSAYFWNPNYQDCKAYFEEHGNLDIPANFKGKSGIFLSDWIQECREEYQKGNLSPEQIEELLEIEVLNFFSKEEKNLFYHLKKFYQNHHHLCIAPKFVCEDGYPLGNKISQIRTKYRKGEVSEYFAKKLENIGFCWDYKDQIWMDIYRFCKQYREEHGDLQIPLDWKSPSGTNVRVWLKLNRISYYKGELSPKRAKLLEEIGGTVYIMPRKFKSLKELQKCQKGKIQPEFNTWQNYCMELRKFYESYHHLSISADVKGADRIPLKYWFISQKNQLKLGRMSENKILFLKQHQMLDLFQSNIVNEQ